MQQHTLSAVWGVVLGLGAPVGSLALQILLHEPGEWSATLRQELRNGAYYYSYMTLGTTLAFGTFGYFLGRRNKALSALSQTDDLTGLYNHRYLQNRLTSEIERSDRYATPVTCLMIDIDDFKKVNDCFGHPIGDEVLRITARLLQECVRQPDCVGRYGGEEFLVILPHTDEKAGMLLAERLLASVDRYPFSTDGSTVPVTISIGCATYPSPERGIKTKAGLLSAADQALYQAKFTGKNRVVCWNP